MKHKISKLLFTAGGVILLVTLAGMGLALAQGGGQLTRLTVAPDSRDSIEVSLNADGTKVAFASQSNFFGPDATTSTFEIWLYNTTTMTYTRITSVPTEEGDSRIPSLSGDGTKVAFLSNINPVSGTEVYTPARKEVWLYDLATKEFTQVTHESSNFPNLSGDGHKVAYEIGPTAYTEIEIYDVESGEYTRVTTATSSGRDSRYPSLNSDGSELAFSSESDLLGLGNVDYAEIWLYDTGTMTYTRITTTPASTSGTRGNQKPSLSGDGRRIVFESDADFFNEGSIENNQYEIWLYDAEAMTYTRITTATGSGYRWSQSPRISLDGRRVVFYSNSTYWDENIADDQYEIWLYDIESKQYTRVTTGTAGLESRRPNLSLAGTRVAFESNVDLTANPVESLGHKEIWLYEGVERMYFPMVKRGE